MALERVLKNAEEEINQGAEVQKNVVKYVYDLINSDYENFADAFRDEIKHDFKGNLKYNTEKVEKLGYNEFREKYFEDELFSKTESMIRKLNEDATSIIGITIYKEKFESPPIKLGFTEYYQFEGLNATGRKLTEKGEKIINDYRKILGFSSIEDSKKKGREVLDKLCNMQSEL